MQLVTTLVGQATVKQIHCSLSRLARFLSVFVVTRGAASLGGSRSGPAMSKTGWRRRLLGVKDWLGAEDWLGVKDWLDAEEWLGDKGWLGAEDWLGVKD